MMKQAIEKTNRENKQILEYDGLTFEIVDKITLGYEVWNIGSNMAEGYLPLCRLKAVQPFPGGREIDIATALIGMQTGVSNIVILRVAKL